MGDMTEPATTTRRTPCARCNKRPRLSEHTGCLCAECEDVVGSMTQAEQDADYEAHQRAGL